MHNMPIKNKYEVCKDSIKSIEYNYLLPVYGQNAYSKGFDIPYPLGSMVLISY
jgi:hypothetical protein